MAKLHVDFHQRTEKIKPMHSVGQPPFCGMDFSYCSYLKNAAIPYSRMHDVGGAFGRNHFVDIPNIFRDFDADVEDPGSYDFAFTDILLAAVIENGCEPYFRLGVTIENYAAVHSYRIDPPRDFHKWARICEHIVRHYNEGWANGFHYGIQYWEIWNEPDIDLPGKSTMWTGTPEQYFALYDVTAKHLKACFGDKIKVGGYAASGFYYIFAHPEKFGMEKDDTFQIRYDTRRYQWLNDYLYWFWQYIKEHQSPIDFFSYHSYTDVERSVRMTAFVDRVLAEFGYSHIERHITEWHTGGDRGTSTSSARVAAMMCALQNTNTDIACYYDARIGIGPYGAWFDGNSFSPCKPLCTYYPFVAFGELYKLGNRVVCSCEEPGIYTLAAENNGKRALLVVNASDESKTIETNIGEPMNVYLIDAAHHLTQEDANASKLVLEKEQVVLMKNF